ncbi:MAG TPA: FAD-dependent oxidoreductase [Chitinophagaceae bacterium]|nr:FAD-dependent oxidoreductase [Chitinophagaceae bacterium]
MQKVLNLKLLPSEALNDNILRTYISQTAAVEPGSVTGYTFLKKSIDARGKQPWINLSLQIFVNEPWQKRKLLRFHFGDVHTANRKVVIVGAGPSGLFAALRLIEQGIKPIILERGKDVRSRRRDLALLNKDGVINPESNYCFGEGGAGTYSDGKLYTRSTKRGDVNRILNVFAHFGAEENILYESHPHIGTNKLPIIITAIRKQIVECGGEFLFERKVTDLIVKKEKLTAVKTSDESVFEADAVILATGHSARDIFRLLYDKKIVIHSKPFALGVRVEHPQSLIDSIQYHTASRGKYLPPSSYSLVQQIHGRGVFSFCMCPGGIIAPAATNEGELVVNGWSPSKRNNPFANSGMVTTIEESDLHAFKKHGPLSGMYFQEQVEKHAFEAGGGKFVAPAQRLVDFCGSKLSQNLPLCSYLPGVRSASLREVLPAFIYENLQQAFLAFGKKMRGYLTNDAIVVATESRTSSPVRIPRDSRTLEHPQIKNFYPCGEGAGYAGGIVSAAIDGERIANQIAVVLRS